VDSHIHKVLDSSTAELRMLAKAAREDLKALRANGYSPTDEDIVALNDLALRIERG